MVGVVILVVGGLYLAACIWVAKRLTARLQPSLLRVLAIVSLVILLMAAPHIDAIWGHIKLKTLCEQEARSTIYGTLAVPANLFDSQLVPKFVDDYGNIVWSSIRPYVLLKHEVDVDYRGIRRLKKVTTRLVRASDGNELAHLVDLYYGGGWFTTYGTGLGADRCLAEPSVDSVLRQIISIQK